MKNFLLVFIGFFIAFGLNAQNGKYSSSSAGISREGYIVKSNYDTIKGSIYIDEAHIMTTNISFERKSTGKSSIHRPGDLISYVTKEPGLTDVVWISTKFSVLEFPPEKSQFPDAFLNVVEQGPLSVYYYYYYKEGDDDPKKTTQYLQLPDKSIVNATNMLLGFAKKMSAHVEDYPELAKKISKKEKGYKIFQLAAIANEYNEWYLKKNPDFMFFTVEAPKKMAVDCSDQIVFKGDPITFAEFPGVEFWLSEPYARYNKWDTQKTGESWLSVALKMKNSTGKPIAKITPMTTAYDKEGNILKQSMGGTSPYGFDPNPGDTFANGYVGVFDAFFSTDMADLAKFKEVKFTIKELGFASAAAIDKPVFDGEWVEFDDFKGFKFRLSKPFVFVDDMSGNNRFGVALEFKNESGKEVDKFYFQIKVYDDQGIFFDEERQNHQRMYEPSIMKPNPTFPADYQGINKKFYTNKESFIEKFKKIEFSLNRIEFLNN